jgi:hypothetical protein
MGLICDQVSWLGLCMKVGRGLTLYGASGPKLRFQATEYCDVDDQLASDPSKLYSGVAISGGHSWILVHLQQDIQEEV